MKIKQVNEIQSDVVSVVLTVSELGTATLDAETERNQLSNFVKTIEYSKIDFKANMKIINGIPVITEEAADEDTINEVSIIDLINKQYTIDENLHITFDIDTNKLNKLELTKVFNNKELLAQAKIVLFAEKVKSTIADKLKEIRDLANTFEGDTDIVL